MNVTECRCEAAGGRLVWTPTLLCSALLHAERTQTVAPQGGGALYTSEDVLTGLLAPLVLFLYAPTIRRGFEAVAEALRTRVGRPQ